MKPISNAEVLALLVGYRHKLVERIWDSNAEFSEALHLTEAQETELDRRLDYYRKDPTTGSPWPEAKARILQRA
jgi:putative addiction module component (TIGR02574 family)